MRAGNAREGASHTRAGLIGREGASGMERPLVWRHSMARAATAPVRMAVIQSASIRARSSPVVESTINILLLSEGPEPRMRDTLLHPYMPYSSGSRQGIVLMKSSPLGWREIFGGSVERSFIRQDSRTQSTHRAGLMLSARISLSVIIFIYFRGLNFRLF